MIIFENNTRSREITFIHPEWQVGGVERTNSQWITCLQSLGYRCNVVTSGRNDIGVETEGYVHRFKNKVSLYIFFVCFAYNSKALVVTQAYYLPWIFFQVLILRMVFGTKVIIAERNSFLQYRHSWIKHTLMRFIFTKLNFIIDTLVLNSYELSKEHPYVMIKNRSIVIRNPRFDDKDLSIITTRVETLDLKQVAFFGRWAYQKNVEFLLKSVKTFRANNMELRAFCRKTKHSFQEPFVESVITDLVKYPRAIFFCSHFEGYPNILIEARSLGIPVIYSECPTGVREILNKYDNCYKFQKDDIQDLDRAIKLYQTNAKLIPVDLRFAEDHSTRNTQLLEKLESMVS